jgi:hypothetical protein
VPLLATSLAVRSGSILWQVMCERMRVEAHAADWGDRGEITCRSSPAASYRVGYPVSRLTLLFFGAAKDVPEAAETVTAGTASRLFSCALQIPFQN